MKQEQKTIDELIAADKAANESAYKRLKKIANQLEQGKFYRVSDSSSQNISYFQFDRIKNVSAEELTIKVVREIVKYSMNNNDFIFDCCYGKYKIEEIPEAFFESLRLSKAILDKQYKELFEEKEISKK